MMSRPEPSRIRQTLKGRSLSTIIIARSLVSVRGAWHPPAMNLAVAAPVQRCIGERSVPHIVGDQCRLAAISRFRSIGDQIDRCKAGLDKHLMLSRSKSEISCQKGIYHLVAQLDGEIVETCSSPWSCVLYCIAVACALTTKPLSLLDCQILGRSWQSWNILEVPPNHFLHCIPWYAFGE